jgi:hypothetical protein
MERGEEREQARFIKWTHMPAVRAIAPELRWMFHCPNGGKRDAITGGQMRALGVKPGVPDLLMPIARHPWNGLAIEMKSSTGTASKEQKEWMDELQCNDWLVFICRSADEARSACAAYLGFMASQLPPL